MRRLFLLLASASLVFAQKRPFDVNAMMELKRIGDPQISPDGKWVAFTVQTVDVAANKKPQQIWIVPLDGGAPRQITHDGEANQRPRWSPDSRRIAYVSDRGGSSQIWLMDPDGGNAKQVTNLSTEADGVLFSPDGKNLLFTSAVYPECGADDACNKKNLDAEKASKVKARIYTELLYRHWTPGRAARRSHLLVVPVGGGAPKDLTPGTRDVPPFSLGGRDDYDISPDGQEVCYSHECRPGAGHQHQLRSVRGLDRGRRARARSPPLRARIPARAIRPTASTSRGARSSAPGYESDRLRLMVLERATGKVTNLTENLDRWVNSFTWSPDSANLFFTTADRGRQAIQLISVNGGRHPHGGQRRQRTGRHAVDARRQDDGLHPADRRVARRDLSRVFHRRRAGGADASERPGAERLPADAARGILGRTRRTGRAVQSFVVKPYGFTPARKYPGADADPRRAAGQLGTWLDLSLERAGVRRRRLRGGDAQSARLHRVRAEVHRRDQ